MIKDNWSSSLPLSSLSFVRTKSMRERISYVHKIRFTAPIHSNGNECYVFIFLVLFFVCLDRNRRDTFEKRSDKL